MSEGHNSYFIVALFWNDPNLQPNLTNIQAIFLEGKDYKTIYL